MIESAAQDSGFVMMHAARDSGAAKSCCLSSPAKWIVPVALCGLGVAGNFKNAIINREEVREERQENFPRFSHSLDNYAQFSPIAAVYLFDWAGNKARHDLLNRSLILLKAQAMMLLVVHPLKKWTHVLRPDSSAYNSFPSGHTAQAFLAANFLQHELGYKSIWYTVAGYTVASGVGIFRVLNNRHWVSDVLAGAGIGVLCSEAAYATHSFRWNRKIRLSALPFFDRNAEGIYLAWQL